MIGLLRHGLHQACDLQVPISRSTSLTYTHEAVRPLRRSSCSCWAEALTMRRDFPPELAFTLELVSGVYNLRCCFSSQATKETSCAEQ